MDSDSDLLKKSVQRLPDIRNLGIDRNKDITELCTEVIGAVVPFVSAVKPVINLYGHYKERKFAKRAVLFLSSLSESDISQQEIDDFIEELSNHTHEKGYDTITGMIDRLDNENKACILSNLVHSCAARLYGKRDFLRATNALERVPFSDLLNLKKYRKNYYEAGESEMLAASGLIVQTNINPGHWDNGDDGGFKYGLSKLGEIMLRFGFKSKEYKYEGEGVNIGIQSIQEAEIEEMFADTHNSNNDED